MAYRGAPRGAGAGPRLSTGHHQQQQRTGSPAATPRGWGSPAPQHQQPAQQQQQQSAAATASAFPSLSGKAKPEDKMKERLLFVLVSLIGNTVVATTTAGRKYVGILHSTSNDAGGQLGVALSSAQELQPTEGSDVSTNLGPPARLLVIKGQDLDIVEAHEVVLGEPVNDTPSNGAFRTDVEISAREADDRFSQGRTLTAWADDNSSGATDGHLDGATATSTGTGTWDQFAANEARFGVKSNYDEDMYTTKLDRSRKNFKEEEKKAERLAAEIMGQTSTNSHLAEERGQVDDSGQNEEDKYGAVVRGPGAYVPPAARRAAEAAAAANGSGVSSASPAAATASPRLVLQEASEKKAAAASTVPVPGIAVKVPTPTKKADGPAGTESTSPGSANPGDSLRDFHQFVASEKVRVQNQRLAAREQQKRGIITNKEQSEQAKRQTLSDLKAWSSTFKLKTPVPDDVASVGQRAPGATPALQKSLSPTTAHTQTTALNKATPGTSSAVPSPSGGAGTAGAVPAAKSVSSSGKLADSKALLANMTIPKIPPFKAKPAVPAAAPAQPAAAAGLPSSASTTFKMSAKASTFKPFNPAAPSFTPGASVAAAAAAAAAAVSPAMSNAASVKPAGSSFGPNAALANPFFGTRVLKMSPAPIHVREDFNPFKTGKVPEASTVAPNWPYSGKSYRTILSVPGPNGPVDGQQQPNEGTAASTGGSSATGLPPTPASQHQSAHGTPSSQASGMLGGATPSSQPQQAHPHGQPLGASPGPLQSQHVGPGGVPPMGHMGAGGPHPVQQGQAPFGMVYQPGGPGGPYRFPPQQPMQGQFMVHGVPGMGMPVGVGGPPMQFGGPGHVPQPGMPPFMGGGGHGAHMGPHGHALGPGQHQMHHPQHINQHQQQQQQQQQQPQHTGNNGPHPGALHPPPPVGIPPHQMHYASPPVPPQQQHSAGPMMGAPSPQTGPPPPSMLPAQQQQQQQPPFSATASPQIGGNNSVRVGGGPPSGGNQNGSKQQQQQQQQQGGAGGARNAKNASGRPMNAQQYATSGSPAPTVNSQKGKGGGGGQ